MDSFQCSTGFYNWSECRVSYEHNLQKVMQDKLESPIPWIRMFIVAASVVCSLAMAADAFHGFRSKMLWFPCKYFSFNAMSLTLLAVTLKIPVDLTADTFGIGETLAPFMFTAMANFMTSLGSVDDNEMLLNLTALGIMIITVIGNVCIHIIQMRFYFYSTLEKFATIFLFLFLVILCSSALTVVTTRSYIECKYQEMCKIALDEEKLDEPKFPIEKMRLVIKKYWVMAVTGCPQFVMARSVTCTASALMCVLVALTLAEAHIRRAILYRQAETFSAYKWSIKWILYVQSIGVALGTIATAFRWFIAARYKCSDLNRKSFKNLVFALFRIKD